MYQDIASDQIPRIQLLSEHLIDQIKAGEVIESTANMAKELIENSIDAKATKIIIKVKNNPMDFFSITDDGHGIKMEDLPLVFARHATSKIHSFEDIYQLSSYGFRGEALASLGAVAKVKIKTKTIFDHSINSIEQIFGQTELGTASMANEAFTQGTEIIVTDLFQNTPARLKFIQNKIGEMQRFKKMLNAYLLSHPHITWDIHIDDDFQRFEKSDETTRFKKLLSKNFEVKKMEYKNVSMTLVIDTQTQKKKNFLDQYIFVNQRPIIFPVAHSILVKTLGITPPYALFIETQGENIDVNVHPAKTEVKFLDKSVVLSLLSSILKNFAPAKVESPNYSSPVTQQDVVMDHQTSNVLSTNFKNLFLITKNAKVLWGLRIDLLIQYILTKVQHSSEDTSFPLLVAKPILGIQHTNISKSFFVFWSQRGLQLDIAQKNTILIRSIPLSWLNLNYELLTIKILQEKVTTQKMKIPADLLTELVNPQQIDLLMSQCSENELVEMNILQSLDQLKIHE